MIFLNPLVLWALVGAGLPVAIHLFARKKGKPVDLPTLRFLKISRVKTGRIEKLKEVLVLSLRTLLVLCCVLALAAPAARTAALFARERYTILLLDDSYSLAAHPPESPWKRLQELSLTTLASLRKPVHVGIVYVSGRTVPFTRNLEECGTLIRRSDVSASAGDIGRALHAALAMLKDKNGEKNIYFFTDLQRALWDSATGPGPKEFRQIKVALVDVGSPADDNAGLKSVEFLPDNTARITVINWSDRPLAAPLSLEGEGWTRTAGLNVPAGASATVSASLPRLPDRLTVRLDRPDALDLDNHLYASTRAANRKIAVINDDPASLFYLSRALAARTDSSGINGQAGLEVKKPEAAQDIPWDEYGLVILAGAGRLSQETVRRLADYVNGGGHLAVFPGGRDTPDTFNRDWAPAGQQIPIMPAALDRSAAVPDGARVTWIDTRHPFFAGFGEKTIEYLKNVRITRCFTLTGTTGDVLMRTNDGAPLLVEKRLGRGTVLLASLPLDIGWTNLPLKPFFPVLIEAIVRTRIVQDSSGRQVDDPVRIPAQATAGQVFPPSGNPINVTAGPARPSYDQPGFWRLHWSRGGRDLDTTAAVNVNWREGDLKRASPPETAAHFAGSDFRYVRAEGLDRHLAGRERSSDLSGLFLNFALILLCLEIAVSNGFHARKIHS